MQTNRLTSVSSGTNGAADTPLFESATGEIHMRTRRSFALAVTVVAVGLLTQLVGPSFAVANEGPTRTGALHVTKECSQYTGAAGDFCTITSSNVRAIEVGMRVVYHQAIGPANLDSDFVLSFRRGSTAYGHVTLDDLAGTTGKITLNGGTGDFRNFHARALLTCSDAVNCAWDGTYSFRR
jgi:hypothetical protein